MKKRTKVAAIGVVAAVAVLVVMRMAKPEEEMVVREIPVVKTTVLKQGDLELETALMGSIQPADTYYVMPKTAGEIQEIYVQNGDSVEAGDPICKIDNSTQLEATKIQLDSAKVSYQTASKALERMLPLYQAGDVSAQTYEQTKAQVDGAKLQLDAAQLQYDTQLEYAMVTAPAAGVVMNTAMTLNAMAAQSTQLCVIAGEGAKTVSFQVTENVFQNLSIGDAVTVEKQGSSYRGSIMDLSAMVNPQTGLFPVKAALEEADGLADGTSCKLYLVTERAEAADLIPTDCIYYSGGDAYVYVYENGTVRKTDIDTGLSDEEWTQVLSGLNAADQVIASWTKELYDGAAVTLAEE